MPKKRRKQRQSFQQHIEHNNEGRFLREIILGAQDALISVLGFVAGFAGVVTQSNIIFFGGAAAGISGALSMFAAGYLSTKSQQEYYKREIEREKYEMEHMPQQEKKEIRDIYKKKGFTGRQLDGIVNKISSNKKIWLDTMLVEELGLTKKDFDHPLKIGSIIGISFLLAAIVPIFPFLFLPTQTALPVALFLTIFILFFIGATKTTVTKKYWIKSGFEMMFIGILVAFISHLLGKGVAQLIALYF